MGHLDQQLMVAKETTYGTPVTVTRGMPWDGDSMPIKPIFKRTEGNPMRPGSGFRLQGRAIPYFDHAEGHVDLEWMNKGMTFWLEHMLGTVGTTGAGPYVHTGTEGTSGALYGKSFTAQFNYPFAPTGTNQAFTFGGGKISKWSISNTVDGMLVLGLDMWFNQYTTATALATYAETPAPTAQFSWVNGAVTIGGTQLDLTDFSIEVDNGYADDRAQIRGNSQQKEPLPGAKSATFSLAADFDALTQFNRVNSATVSGMSAALVGTWTNGADIVTVTVPGARFDDLDFGGDRGAATQTLTGVVEWDATNSPVSVAVTSGDSTP